MYIVKNIYVEHMTCEMLIERLNALYPQFITWYAFIIHDKDKNANGEPKKSHFHLIIDSDSKSHHLKQDLKDALDAKGIWLGCEPNQKQIEAVRNVKKAVRYLTHKDNLEKAQYLDEQVITSDTELYKDFITIQVQAKEIDNMLNDLLDYAYERYEQKNEMTSGEILLWFKRLGRLDYYLKNSSKIKVLINDYINEMSKVLF